MKGGRHPLFLADRFFPLFCPLDRSAILSEIKSKSPVGHSRSPQPDTFPPQAHLPPPPSAYLVVPDSLTRLLSQLEKRREQHPSPPLSLTLPALFLPLQRELIRFPFPVSRGLISRRLLSAAHWPPPFFSLSPPPPCPIEIFFSLLLRRVISNRVSESPLGCVCRDCFFFPPPGLYRKVVFFSLAIESVRAARFFPSYLRWLRTPLFSVFFFETGFR